MSHKHSPNLRESNISLLCGVVVVHGLCPCLIAALSDDQSNSLLNGNFVVAMFKREITFKGIVIDYSGSDTKVERINCTDRIDDVLVLQVSNESIPPLVILLNHNTERDIRR